MAVSMSATLACSAEGAALLRALAQAWRALSSRPGDKHRSVSTASFVSISICACSQIQFSLKVSLLGK